MAPEPGEGILVETGEAGAADMDLAFARTLQAGNDHHHRGFAGARGAYHADRLAGLDDQVEAAQNVDRTGRRGPGQLDGFERDHGVGGRPGRGPGGAVLRGHGSRWFFVLERLWP